MLVISGIFRLAPESRDKALEIAAVMAKASRAEDGCHAYSFYTDIEDQNTIRIFEEWESDDALKAHFNTPHMKVFQAGMAKLTIRERQVKRYEVAGVGAL